MCLVYSYISFMIIESILLRYTKNCHGDFNYFKNYFNS